MAKMPLSASWGAGRFAQYPAFVEAAKTAGFAWIELNRQFSPDRRVISL